MNIWILSPNLDLSNHIPGMQLCYIVPILFKGSLRTPTDQADRALVSHWSLAW